MAHARMNPVGWMGLACLVLGACLGLTACGRGDKFTFSQESPEDVLESARRMVTEGHAELLTELIYAEDERIRKLYRGVGGLLGALEDLALTVAEKFPGEVGRVKSEAERAAKEGKSSSLLTRAITGARGGREQSRFARSDDPLNDVIQSLLADPYGWINANADNLSTVIIDDTRVGVLWNKKPIFPPFGLLLERKEDDKWYIILPTSLPSVQKMLPQTDDQLDLWLAVFASVENALIDLRQDIHRGRVVSLEQAAAKAGEYALPTTMFAFYAFGKYREEMEKKPGPTPEAPAQEGT